MRNTGFTRHYAERKVLRLLRVVTPTGMVAIYQGTATFYLW